MQHRYDVDILVNQITREEYDALAAGVYPIPGFQWTFNDSPRWLFEGDHQAHAQRGQAAINTPEDAERITDEIIAAVHAIVPDVKMTVGWKWLKPPDFPGDYILGWHPKPGCAYCGRAPSRVEGGLDENGLCRYHRRRAPTPS